MFMAFLLVSSWLPAQAQKEPQIHQNQRLPGRTGMAIKNSNRERSSEGEEGGSEPLAPLAFSMLRSRAILDFCPLPPPIVDGSGAGDDGVKEACAPPGAGRPRARCARRFVVHGLGRIGGWQTSTGGGRGVKEIAFLMRERMLVFGVVDLPRKGSGPSMGVFFTLKL